MTKVMRRNLKLRIRQSTQTSHGGGYSNTPIMTYRRAVWKSSARPTRYIQFTMECHLGESLLLHPPLGTRSRSNLNEVAFTLCHSVNLPEVIHIRTFQTPYIRSGEDTWHSRLKSRSKVVFYLRSAYSMHSVSSMRNSPRSSSFCASRRRLPGPCRLLAPFDLVFKTVSKSISYTTLHYTTPHPPQATAP